MKKQLILFVLLFYCFSCASQKKEIISKSTIKLEGKSTHVGDLINISVEDMIQQTVASWMDYTIKAPMFIDFNPDRLWYPDGTPALPNTNPNYNNIYNFSPYNTEFRRNKIKKDEKGNNSLEKYLRLNPAR